MRLLLILTLLVFIFLPALPSGAQEDDIPGLIEQLRQIPPLYNTDHANLYAIFETGQALGNYPNIFTKVGDSNTTGGDFLYPIGLGGQFCDLGEYEYLQETIDYFSALSPRPGEDNSFTSYSLAAIKGLSAAGALDSFWADPSECEPGESPLLCEYRVVKPSVAVIMLGSMDVKTIENIDTYRLDMDTIVQQSIEQGVIPVLTTIIVLQSVDQTRYENSIRMNLVLVELADEYGIPLINLWATAEPLPRHGIGGDNSHLAARTGEFCNFAGGQDQYGGTLRNLLTLQMLDDLREHVLEEEAG